MERYLLGIRAYLVLVGIIGILNHVNALMTMEDTTETAGSVISVALAFIFLFCGVSFRMLLVKSPHVLEKSLIIAVCLIVLLMLLDLTAGLWKFAAARTVGLVVISYLIHSVRRITREARVG